MESNEALLRQDTAVTAPRSSQTFETVYAESMSFVWRSLRRLGVRDADAPDVCQEVFMIVYRRRSELSEVVAIKAWLFAIALRVASNHRRRAHVRHESPGEAIPEFNAADERPDPTDAIQARAMLDEILAGLDESKRAVFIMFELEQMAMVDIATALECPVQTAYARLYAARSHVTAAARRIQLRLGAP